MKRLLLAPVLLFGAALSLVAAPALAQSANSRGQDIIVADMHRPGVDDPRGFVAATYARYQASPDEPPQDQAYAYSPRLKALFDAYDAWSRQHDDLVGALDFDWWTNAQDYSLRNLVLTERDEGVDRRWIVAVFDNYDRHDEVRFLFVRQDGRWYLDEAVEGTGGGDNGWTLSDLLRRREG